MGGQDLARRTVCIKIQRSRLGNSKKVNSSQVEVDTDKTMINVPDHPRFFFDHSCDRPGCYEGFVRQGRSPHQRFCSRSCRRAMERVWQRERRWRRTVQRQRRI